MLRIHDSWVLSKLQLVIEEVGSAFGKCRFHEGAKAIEEFIIAGIFLGGVALVYALMQPLRTRRSDK